MADLIESCCRVKKPNRQVKKGRTDEKAATIKTGLKMSDLDNGSRYDI